MTGKVPLRPLAEAEAVPGQGVITMMVMTITESWGLGLGYH